jgi:hypothetical protein
MSNRSEAEENLRVIRNLMEKATIYRAVSAPGALVGGTCSIALLVLALVPSRSVEIVPFLGSWIAVLGFTSLANFWLLRRDAARRGDAFISPGMRLALRAMLPALLGGGACTFVEGDGGPVLIASLWVLFYGVSLLAAAHFAPKSINWLGRAFFVAGFALIFVGAFAADWWRGAHQTAIAHGIMGATFGVFHLVYAACTWPRRAAAAAKP